MDNEPGDRYSDHLPPPSTAGNSQGDPPLLFAACLLSSMSYTGVLVTMVASAIRRGVRRRSEVRALERAFARTDDQPKNLGLGRRRIS
jgi:hypothetical protein